MKFKRSRMAEHLQNQCEYRNVKCNYCAKDVTFASIKVSSVKIIFPEQLVIFPVSACAEHK